MKDTCNRDMEFGWPVRIGMINFLVPVRFLAEYKRLSGTAGEEEFKEFIESVRRECVILPRGMQVVK